MDKKLRNDVDEARELADELSQEELENVDGGAGGGDLVAWADTGDRFPNQSTAV